MWRVCISQMMYQFVGHKCVINWILMNNHSYERKKTIVFQMLIRWLMKQNTKCNLKFNVGSTIQHTS